MPDFAWGRWLPAAAGHIARPPAARLPVSPSRFLALVHAALSCSPTRLMLPLYCSLAPPALCAAFLALPCPLTFSSLPIRSSPRSLCHMATCACTHTDRTRIVSDYPSHLAADAAPSCDRQYHMQC